MKLNGRVVRELGTQAEPTDLIEVDGEAIRLPKKFRYVILHKPLNIVCTRHDEANRPTIFDFLYESDLALHPVGRLDFDSTGLLLLTNEGELTYRLTHPKFRVPKTYRVALKPWPDEGTMRHLRHGVELEDGLARATRAKLVFQDYCDVTITEGRNREVRRMFEVLGHEVTWLCRTHFGPLGLGELRAGKARPLKEAEVLRVRECVGLE